MRRAPVCAALLLAALPLAAFAATREQAQESLAQAEKTEAEAATFNNRWVPTEAALKDARSALKAGDWDKAVAAASLAQALAARSVEQSHEQETAWRDAVIR